MSNQQTIMALPPRALRRNRLVLGACVLVAAPALGMLAGDYLAAKPIAAPLLLSVDQFRYEPVGGAETSISSTSPGNSMTVALPDQIARDMLDAVARDEATVAIDAPDTAESHTSQRWFNGRPVRPVGTVQMTVTAYSPDEKSCGGSADGITASGYSVWTNGMKMAAADTSVLPFGSLISVPGYDNGNVVPVLDRGGAITGQRLDMLYPTHEQARRFGVQKLEVTVWEYADGKPSDYQPIYKAADSVIARSHAIPAG